MEGIGKIAIVDLWLELYRLVSEGLENEYSPLPDLATLIAGILGIIYGTPFVRKQNLLISVDAIKGAIAFICTTSFLVRASSSLKRCLVVVSLISVLILSKLFILYLMSIHTYYGRSSTCCTPFIIFNIVVGALPSLSVVKAYRDKSREGILFYRTIISICNGICWFCFGVILNDIFIIVINVVAVLFNVSQIVVYYLYPIVRETSIVVQAEDQELDESLAIESFCGSNTVRRRNELSLETMYYMLWYITTRAPSIVCFSTLRSLDRNKYFPKLYF